MDILYRAGRGTVAEVRSLLPDPPSYSAVRAMLRILEEKGHVRHEHDAARYIFMPTIKRDAVKRSALKHVINTFFEGSASQVMAALVEMSGRGLNQDELTRLRQVIDEAKKRRKE
jgi:predicted transcriptional regulator